jgi:hypothetical protein
MHDWKDLPWRTRIAILAGIGLLAAYVVMSEQLRASAPEEDRNAQTLLRAL